MCIDYWMLNKTTQKDHFPLPFIDEMLERLAKNSFFCYLDRYLVIIKVLFIRMTRVRLPSPVLTACSPTGECCLVFAMHRFISKVYDGDLL
jgi:hypothetical protein